MNKPNIFTLIANGNSIQFQAFQPFIQKKKEERELKNNLIAEILKHIQNRSVEGLLSENGAPDLPKIRRLYPQFSLQSFIFCVLQNYDNILFYVDGSRLFENIDRDGNNFISQSELRELIGDIKFGTEAFDVDEAVASIIEFFDSSGDQMIDEGEFVYGLTKWFDKTNNGDSEPPQTKDSFFQVSRLSLYIGLEIVQSTCCIEYLPLPIRINSNRSNFQQRFPRVVLGTAILHGRI